MFDKFELLREQSQLAEEIMYSDFALSMTSKGQSQDQITRTESVSNIDRLLVVRFFVFPYVWLTSAGTKSLAREIFWLHRLIEFPSLGRLQRSHEKASHFETPTHEFQFQKGIKSECRLKSVSHHMSLVTSFVNGPFVEGLLAKKHSWTKKMQLALFKDISIS